jgi:hypothetical protein
MDRFTTNELGLLLKKGSGIHVSFFLPTHRVGRETLQDPTRLKNLLREAEAELAAWIPRGAETLRLLQPVTDLIESKKFWRDLSDGLAIFLSEQGMVTYRVPLSFADQVVVSDRFYVKPLLPLLTEDGRFYLLALSQKTVRLFRASRDAIESVPLNGIPTSLKESMNQMDTQQLEALYRPTSSRASTGTGAFYGHGSAVEESKDEVRQFFLQLSKGLRGLMTETQWPLLLAGGEPILAIFREANTYPHTMEARLGGNADEVGEQELHTRAWAVMGPYFYRRLHEVSALFDQKLGTGLASADVTEVLRAAMAGRVDRLIIAKEADQWGRYDPESGTVTVHPAHQPGDEALLDRCAAETLLHHGEVFAVAGADIPKAARGAPVAAIYRF